MFCNDAVTISNILRVLAESIGKCRKGKGRTIAESRLKAEMNMAPSAWKIKTGQYLKFLIYLLSYLFFL